MDYSIDTPFSSYADIQEAVKTKKAILSYDRTGAYNIACSVKPAAAISNLIIPIISVIAMFIVCQVFGITKWVLLFGVVALLLNTLVPHLKGLFIVIAIALIALPLLWLKGSMWMLAIGAGIIGMILGYYIWWGYISGLASNKLMTDEELFEAAWKAKKVALRTDNTIDGFYTYGKAEVDKIRAKLNQ